MIEKGDTIPAGAGGNDYPPHFVFKACATAFAARIVQTDIEKLKERLPIGVIEGQCSLPVFGGPAHAAAQGSDPELRDLFEYGQCSSHCEGKQAGPGHETTVAVSLDGLRITNRESVEHARGADRPFLHLEAGRLAFELKSRHPWPRRGKPSIGFTGAPVYQGLRLASRDIELELAGDWIRPAHLDDLEDRFRKDRKFFDKYCDRIVRRKGSRRPVFGQCLPRCGDSVVTSIVRSIRWGDQKIDGHVLQLAGFGTIFFGETRIAQEERRISMLRIKLGCGTGGDGSGPDGGSNGSGDPPN